MIRGYARSQPGLAYGLIQKMKTYGVIPKIDLYHIVMKAATSLKDHSLVRSCFAAVQERQLPITAETWNYVLDVYARSNHLNLALKYMTKLRGMASLFLHLLIHLTLQRLSSFSLMNGPTLS